MYSIKKFLTSVFGLVVGAGIYTFPVATNGEIPAITSSPSTPSLTNVPVEQPTRTTGTTTPTLIPTTPTSTETTSLATTTQYQNNGVIFNNDSLNGISSQNCPYGCLQINVKHNTLQNSTELSVGGLFQFGSPDAAKIEMTRIGNQANIMDVQNRQKRAEEDSINSLRRELNEAIATKKIHSMLLISKQLAPKLGYKDHWELLAEHGLNRSKIDFLVQQF
jgi:hypothetical protein